MKIIVNNLQTKFKINPAQIRTISYNISPPRDSCNLKINLYFVKNSIIKGLNKQFFNKNYLTDVISFRLDNDCAEVFIAPCVVKTNALRFKTDFFEELSRCIIHGILHVFGYRDKPKKERNKMWKAQEKILKKAKNLKRP